MMRILLPSDPAPIAGDLRVTKPWRDWASDVTDAALTGNGLLRYACGRLSNLGPSDPFSQCHYVPYNGNLIVIDNRVRVIPDGQLAISGGVQATYTNCSIDKVTGSSLAADTFYYVYVYMNGPTMTMDFSTLPSVLDPRNGTEVKYGDTSCAMIGIMRTNSAITTYGGSRGQTITSFFNRFRATLETAISGSTANNSATALPSGGTLPNGQPNNNWLEWTQFYDESPRVRAFANMSNTVSGNRVSLGIGLNSTVAISGMTATAQVPSTLAPSVNVSVQAPPTDFTGYCYAQVLAYETEDVGAGTLTADGRLYADGVMV